MEERDGEGRRCNGAVCLRFPPMTGYLGDPSVPSPMLHDITQPLHPQTPVWPGDQPVRTAWSARITDGASVNVGRLTASLHAGTHADAPRHVADAGIAIEATALDAYVGPTLVVEVPGEGAVRADELPEGALGAPRLLLKTRQGPVPEAWDSHFRYLDADLARTLAQRGVRLVGIDTPSIDPAESKTLDAHHALFDGGVAVLENLRLDRVAPGWYVLLAAPVAVAGMDAGPVRALLADAETVRGLLESLPGV